MQAMSAKITKALTIGSRLNCDDNSGAKIVQIIGVKRAKARLRRLPSVGIGDIVRVSIKKGKAEMVGKLELAVITRQRKEFRRGKIRVKFDDNACVLIDDQNLPRATEIKGALSRELADRFPKVIAIASAVV
ncbi:MAG: uL14 family ribosomal protein [Candidatus Micrarchaeota archaeon]